MPTPDHSLHHNTPDVTVAGSTGQVVRALRFLRRPGDSPDSPARILVTRTLTDLPARTVCLFGVRPLAAGAPDARSVTGLAGQTLLSRTADAGDTLMLSDAAGRPLWHRNPQGTVTTLQYEPASLPGRPLSLTGHPAGGLSRVRERFSYGTPADAPHNLAGALTVHHDNAGLSEVLSVSLTGVPLRAQQRLLPPEAGLPDWGSAAPPVTDAPLQTSAVTDACGAVLSQQNAAGVTTLNSYDVTGAVARTRLRWQTGAQPGEALTLDRVVRDAGGWVLSQTAGSGVVETYEYAPQTLRLMHHRVARPSGHPSGAAVLADLTYGYDPAGNILSLSDAAVETLWHSNREVTGVRRYTYDTLARLTSASGRERVTADGVWLPYTESFTYDDGDNLIKTVHAGQQGWTREMAVSAANNRAVMVPAGKGPGDVNPDEHFLPGGLQKTLADGRALSWSADGQLGGVSPVVRSDGADDTERYHYSDGGTRVRKVRSTAVSGGRQSTVVTYAGGCETRARRTATGALSLDVVITEGGGVRVVQEQIKNETHLRYGFADHLNSVGGETDAAGNLTSREEYYAYGGSAGSDEEATEVTDRTRRYSGKERDATGLYYYGWRYYQPEAGRWLSADPGGLVDGVNLFRFCRNNPINYSDPDGSVPESTSKDTKQLREADKLDSSADEGIRATLKRLEDDIGTGRWAESNYYRDDLRFAEEIVRNRNEKYPGMNLELVREPGLLAEHINNSVSKGMNGRFVINRGGRSQGHFLVADVRIIDESVSVIAFESAAFAAPAQMFMDMEIRNALNRNVKRVFYIMAEMKIQASNSECFIFSIATAKELFKNEEKLTKLHTDNINGVLSGRLEWDAYLPWNVTDEYISVDFHKHTQSSTRLDQFFSSHPEAKGKGVNKQGSTLMERFESYKIRGVRNGADNMYSSLAHRKRVKLYKSLITQ